jgi:hypothetical protein
MEMRMGAKKREKTLKILGLLVRTKPGEPWMSACDKPIRNAIPERADNVWPQTALRLADKP